MKKNLKYLWLGTGFLALFAVWTLLIQTVDVKAIGPEGSRVGFAAMNQWAHEIFGVNMTLYKLTDLLSFVPFLAVFAFALLGFFQWIKGKKLWAVDRDIFLLGGFYFTVATVFLIFEELAVNYRPVLIEGVLEASYPSSTTLLALTILPTAMLQLQNRVKNLVFRKWLHLLMGAFTAFMVIGRIFSGVHWFSDIVGGILLSAGLVSLYVFCTAKMDT